ncbi:TIGR02679 family protein [Pseudofrankia sp. BMG5.36]|uniref:TIGR02679 family protein n=1 Tax=Pseudofrankia sp. BMG5.36 TaxID=1834512 RepID=UPI0009F6165B|nr:TIGR02679 family protein [Pseudofrankia sp. BMG5.36]
MGADASGPPTGDSERLRRLLGGEHTSWLVSRARRRLEQGRPLTGVATLGNASPDQRRAAELLLGRRAGAGTSLSVSLDDVDALLRASGAAPGGLADAIHLLTGPVENLAAQAAAEASAWSAARAPLDQLVAARPILMSWLSWLDGTGTLGRLTGTPETAVTLVRGLVAVLDALPSPGIALGRLAAACVGDAHALDDGRPLTTLALPAVRVLGGSSPTGDGSAVGRRAAWAAVGVHRDDLSSTVLCLGIPGGSATSTGRILAAATEAGEPCVLTLRQLSHSQHQPDLGVGARTVFLCENPIVLASAADELGATAPPLVCVSGQPSAAVLSLLDTLTRDGARFVYHGDFDWGGLRIANGLLERITWQPWRFDTEAYRTALAVGGGELTGRPVDAAWDPELRSALEQHAIRIDEELVLPDLLADLAAATTRQAPGRMSDIHHRPPTHGGPGGPRRGSSRL